MYSVCILVEAEVLKSAGLSSELRQFEALSRSIEPVVYRKDVVALLQ